MTIKPATLLAVLLLLLSTAYAVAIDSCQSLNVSGTYTLNQSVSTGGGCFPITASAVTLDCAGYSIFASGFPAFSTVVTSSSSGTTVKNCNFVRSAGGGNWVSISGSGAQVLDNNFTSVSLSPTIHLTIGGDNSLVSGNNINVQPVAGCDLATTGIYSHGTSSLTIENNVITGEGTCGNFGYAVDTLGNNNLVFRNNNVTGAHVITQFDGINTTTKSSGMSITGNNFDSLSNHVGYTTSLIYENNNFSTVATAYPLDLLDASIQSFKNINLNKKLLVFALSNFPATNITAESIDILYTPSISITDYISAINVINATTSVALVNGSGNIVVENATFLNINHGMGVITVTNVPTLLISDMNRTFPYNLVATNVQSAAVSNSVFGLLSFSNVNNGGFTTTSFSGVYLTNSNNNHFYSPYSSPPYYPLYFSLVNSSGNSFENYLTIAPITYESRPRSFSFGSCGNCNGYDRTTLLSADSNSNNNLVTNFTVMRGVGYGDGSWFYWLFEFAGTGNSITNSLINETTALINMSAGGTISGNGYLLTFNGTKNISGSVIARNSPLLYFGSTGSDYPYSPNTSLSTLPCCTTVPSIYELFGVTDSSPLTNRTISNTSSNLSVYILYPNQGETLTILNVTTLYNIVGGVNTHDCFLATSLYGSGQYQIQKMVNCSATLSTDLLPSYGVYLTYVGAYDDFGSRLANVTFAVSNSTPNQSGGGSAPPTPPTNTGTGTITNPPSLSTQFDSIFPQASALLGAVGETVTGAINILKTDALGFPLYTILIIILGLYAAFKYMNEKRLDFGATVAVLAALLMFSAFILVGL